MGKLITTILILAATVTLSAAQATNTSAWNAEKGGRTTEVAARTWGKFHTPATGRIVEARMQVCRSFACTSTAP